MRKRKRAQTPAPTPDPNLFRRRAALGFVVGFLFWLAAVQLLIGIVPHVSHDVTYPLFGLLGAWLAVSRMRRLMWAACGVVVLAFLVIGYTPLVSWRTRGWVLESPLRKAPAVVVLAAGGNETIEIGEKGQSRLLHGYEVVRQGYAPVLVVSRGASEQSWIPAVTRQMERLDISAPLLETNRVYNTHDEAVEVAEIARARGWREVILVTHPYHMRRSAALFEKAGLTVVPSPSPEWRYNPADLNNMPSRITALREWLHEIIGCWVYRRRGWID